MKKVIALVMILVVLALCVIAALMAGNKNDVDNNVVDLETDATITVATTVTDADGKIYYVGPTDYDAYQLALEGDLQERIDAAIMGEFMVYDIVREGDSTLQDADGKEINLCYGISSQDMPEEVTILRDGFTVFTWDEEEFEVSDKTDKVFVGAADSKFTSRVFCEEHKAIWARDIVGYPEALEWAEGNKKGIRGPFDLDLLDDELFDAFVLVQREVRIDGKEYNAYTWVVRTCGCNQPEENIPSEPVNPNPTQKPTDNPTQAPTTAPTQKPTDKPTDAPTQKPTDKPTDAPTPSFNPEPTADPTPKPTDKPTDAPTPSFNPEPTADPTPKPTAKPTTKPTTAPTPSFNPEPPADPTPKPTAKPTTKPTTATTPDFNFEPQDDPTPKPAQNSGNSDFSGEPGGDPVQNNGPTFNF